MSDVSGNPASNDAAELILASIPLCGLLGIRAASASPERVELQLEWRRELCTSNEILHGGALMALADTAGAVCAFLNLPAGAGGTATIESKTNFLAAVRRGTVTASSRPLHAGSRTVVVETEVRTDEGRLAAKVTQTQAVL
ncbi:MAG TPA: PaaI family thioesterase [Acidimicrobiales bacterium]|nr:PaaI family thioesterase [Acidimicrobiales bacterium]